MILETTRLNVRELNSASDAEFICALLNSPKFIKYIGDRCVRTAEDAAKFIDERYRKSYRDHGYGLYAVELKDGTQIGICGFVRRVTLPGPDIGFAFLPQYERQGFGYESAAAMMKYGYDEFGFTTIYAITSHDNDASGSLLEKLGFNFDKLITCDGDTVKLFVSIV